jgi:hypothetical protein
MNAGNYFVWHGDPVLYTTGVLWLPFNLSIHGFILGAIIAFFAADWWLKRQIGRASCRERV